MGTHPGFGTGAVLTGRRRVLRTARLGRFLTDAVVGPKIVEIPVMM